jgi:hypothetical protein
MKIHSQLLDYPGAFQSDNILAVKLLSTTELQFLHHPANQVRFRPLRDRGSLPETSPGCLICHQ